MQEVGYEEEETGVKSGKRRKVGRGGGRQRGCGGGFGPGEFECPECGDTYSKLHLVAHLVEIHQWRSVMECQKCWELFRTNHDVQVLTGSI